MSAAFILVVLQVVAAGNMGTYYGWVPMGGFATREACVAAGDALKRVPRDTDSRIRSVECLPTGTAPRQ